MVFRVLSGDVRAGQAALEALIRRRGAVQRRELAALQVTRAGAATGEMLIDAIETAMTGSLRRNCRQKPRNSVPVLANGSLV